MIKKIIKKVKKVLKIGSCSECPYLHWHGYHGDCLYAYRVKNGDRGPTVHDSDTIPDWCPL